MPATTARERPILMGGELVREILRGNKTETRRPIKPQLPAGMEWNGDLFQVPGTGYGVHRRPLCHVGDVLWVRETWRQWDHQGEAEDGSEQWTEYHYRADRNADVAALYQWKPSIHMPRDACRLLLDVVSVKPERLQDMTFASLQREGPPTSRGPDGWRWFRSQWDSIYPALPWESNPWVWAISFRPVVP